MDGLDRYDTDRINRINMKRAPAYPVLLALLLTVALAGCRREPLPEAGNVIRFSVEAAVAVDVQTKADGDLPDAEEVLKSNPIALYGFCTKSSGTETLFNGAPGTSALTYNTTLGWHYDPLRYWNQGGVYDFRAVSPASSVKTGGSAAITTGSKVEANYGNYDLMVASNHSTTPLASSSSVAPVALAFSHAASAVRFVFKKGNDDRTIQITHLEVNNIYAFGTMTYSWDGQKDAITSTPDANSKTDLFGWTWDGVEDPWELTDAYQCFDGWHLVVPQTLNDQPAAKATVKFSYKIGNGEAQSAILSIPDHTWLPGKTYEYQINLDVLAIGLTFTVKPWPTSVVDGSYTVR